MTRGFCGKRRVPYTPPNKMGTPQLRVVESRASATVDGLLQTKIHPPRPRQAVVRRRRLLDPFRSITNARLVLVSAPAGFGKSTFVSSLAAESGERVAWLSLDEEDAATERFVRYLIASLREVMADIGSSTLDLLNVPEPIPAEMLMTPLLNELATRGRLMVVLDDYHLVSGGPVDEIVRFTVDAAPSNVTIVISTRSDPRFSLSRLRVRGELIELRASDLRFTTEEAASFLHHTMQLDLTGSEVDLVEEKTEGWAAGLQLAALSLKGREDRTAFLKEFSGSHRFVIDYLADEILQHLDGELRSFVLRISLLSRFCAPLCDAVTRSTGASSLIDRLEGGNLFLIPLDENRTWYRFHHLFGDFLRRELESCAAPGEREALHDRAAAWLHDAGYPEEAIDHACQAGSRERAIAVLEAFARPVMATGDLMRVARWFERVPSGWLEGHAILLFDYATALYGNLRIREFLAMLPRFERIAAASKDPEVAHCLTTLHLLRDTANAPPADTLARARAFLQTVDDARIRAIVGIILGIAAMECSELEEANRWLEEAKRCSVEEGNPLLALVASSFVGWSLYVAGEIDRAEEEWDQALALAGPDGTVRNPAASVALAGRSGVALDRNRLNEARDFAREAIEAGRVGVGSGRIHALTHLVWVELGAGNADAARAAAREVEEFLRTTGGERGIDCAAVLALRVELELARGSSRGGTIKDILRRLEEFDDSDPAFDIPGDQKLTLPLTLGRAHLLDGNPHGAREVLDRAIGIARAGGLKRDLCEALLLRALVAAAERREELARGDFVEALELVARQGFVSLVTRYREEVAPLFRIVDVESVVGHELAGALREGCGSSRFGRTDSLLSDREVEILAAVAEGQSNAEVAERLFISPQTVKKHLENIYAKLGVGNRTEAVAEARREGLLP
jgi:LuxR family transcriptional regulator, maltose regulon positive regulatory protein